MNALGNLVDPATVQGLGWTLIHFVWQGGLVALALAGVNACLPRTAARGRYAAACVALLVMAALPVVSFAPLRTEAARALHAAGLQSRAAGTVAATGEIAAPMPMPDPPIDDTAMASVFAPAGLSQPSARLIARAIDAARRAAARPRPLLPWVVAAWCAGVVLLSLRVLGGWMVAQRLRAGLASPRVAALAGTLERLCREIGVSRPVRLVESLRVDVPTVIGWLRPVLLVPASAFTGLTPAQLEALLAHELAHVRRHDYAVNLAQTAIETLLFYHPAVWWVSHRIRVEREHCCDDIAVAVCGDPLVMARALAELEGLRVPAPRLALAANGGSLFDRVRRLVQRGQTRSMRPSQWVAGVVALAALVVLVASARATRGTASPRARIAPPASCADTPAIAGIPAIPALPALAPEPAAHAGCARPCPESAEAPPAPESSVEAPEAMTAPPVVPEAPALPEGTPSPEPSLAPPAPVTPPTPEASPAPATLLVQAMSRATASAQAITLKVAPLMLTLSDPSSLKVLEQNGIEVQQVAELAEAGAAELSIGDQVRLIQGGVDADFVRGMAEAGYANLSARELLALRMNGVDPDYVSELRRLGCGPLPVRDLVVLRQQGVTPDYAAGMHWLGYDQPLQDLVQLRQQGVDPEYVAELSVLGHRRLTAEQIIGLRQQGVTADFVSQLRVMGFHDLSTTDLIALRVSGVTPDYVAQLRALGYDALTPRDIILMRTQGITPEYIAQLGATGSRRLPAADLVRLRNGGVSTLPDLRQRLQAEVKTLQSQVETLRALREERQKRAGRSDR